MADTNDLVAEQEAKKLVPNAERFWSYSTVTLFQKCKKKYFFTKVMKIEGKTKSPALVMGDCLQEAIEIFYTFVERKEPRAAALEKAITVFKMFYNDFDFDDVRTTANAIKLLEGYELIYRHEPFKIVGQEITFVVPVTYKDKNGETKTALFTGRLDGLVTWNGAHYVLENKSTSQLGPKYFFEHHMSWQIDGYHLGGAELIGKDKKLQGVIVNAMELWKDVKRVTEKTKKLEDHFARDPISRSEFELTEFVKDFGYIVEEILEAERTGVFPRNKTACFSYNYKCVYWDLCKYGENPTAIARDFKEAENSRNKRRELAS